MQVIKTINEMKQARRVLPGPVGFVPTMGYLHEGHLFLARQARAANESSVVSIFVNPTQFGPQEDFDRYPRDPERDLAMLQKEKVDVVFIPEPVEIYPPGFSTWVEVGGVSERLEGASRPGHFRGVATVVAKLFNIVEPDHAYFGQKDAQQTVVVKKMVADLNMNLQVVVIPTVRESDGLAMSSRNIYLSIEERKQAPVLYRSLQLAERLYKDGERDAGTIRRQMTDLIRQQSLARIEYISIADGVTLQELETIQQPAVLSMVVRFGKTRLLDNVVLE
jgi:pantoate--beta-alanine ligase